MCKVHKQFNSSKSHSSDLQLDPVLHHLGNGLHDLVVWGLLDKPREDGADEALLHVVTHHSHTVLHQVQRQDQQLAGHGCKCLINTAVLSAQQKLKSADHRHHSGLGTCCARTPTPSPKLQSTGPQRESASVVDRRQPGEELWKRKWRTWTTAGAPSRGWPETVRGQGALLLPSTPAGVTGSKDEDDRHQYNCRCLTQLHCQRSEKQTGSSPATPTAQHRYTVSMANMTGCVVSKAKKKTTKNSDQQLTAHTYSLTQNVLLARQKLPAVLSAKQNCDQQFTGHMSC